MNDAASPLSSAPDMRTDPDMQGPDMQALLAAPFTVSQPETHRAPFVFASPHSGRVYPASFARASRLDAVSLRRSEDAFVEELFASVPAHGAPLIAARFPRAFLDVNRAPGELDISMFETPFDVPVGPRTPRVAAGLGVIPRVVREGMEIYAARLPEREARFRLTHFYTPYHAALADLVADTQKVFGTAIVIDCHSMPHTTRGPDIVIGDCFGEAASLDLVRLVERIFSDLGFSVARNTPYAGGYTTSLYGQPKSGVQALQIEIRRALYLDESRLEKTSGFDAMAENMSRFVESLMRAMRTPKQS